MLSLGEVDEAVMYSSDTVIIIFYAIFALLALWGLIQAWIHQSRTETIHPFKAFIHLLAFIYPIC